MTRRTDTTDRVAAETVGDFLTDPDQVAVYDAEEEWILELSADGPDLTPAEVVPFMKSALDLAGF